ncbi:TonB-dependent receptor [Bowmanella dokdonensis]|uniref:TonB-dependent receptor n=1 Tax=Bowmanella dokdonensis TaxID=751969 RepID=A0A939IPA0_9ALTE|nr:TonB-dependent receptor [Bowmanella dokdonensis]MBN7823769.1 TonB-dependent receptor [Bowmanella dokdonensis]
MGTRQLFKPNLLSWTIASLMAGSLPVAAQEEAAPQAEGGIEKIQVTATRRAGTVQDVPLNITALNDDVIREQNIGDLEDVARWVPGLTVTDQGGREGSPVIVRGLNTTSSDRATDAGTVAKYLGEIPLNINLRLTDVERVEVLIGPQGTLYGAGTLGGAIRYMLKAPVMDFTEGEISGDLFTLAHSSDVGGEAGFVFNTPIIDDELAVRASLNYYDRPGYVDYNYVVRDPGVSLPDPDWSDPAAVEANLRKVEDANDEKIFTGRVSLRWTPNEDLDATLNYFYQRAEHEGNSIVQYQSISDLNPIGELIGPYESAYRYEEPNERDDELLSLEVKYDLGFAELVSATGFSSYDQVGQRDQTDLLYDIYSGYADFPAFAAYTRDTGEDEVFTQEVRLVSQGDSDWNWIVGAFYNHAEGSSDDREYTPGLTEFWRGAPDGQPNIEQDLEYIALSDFKDIERALFGEVGYQATEDLSLTVGARFYEYDLWSQSGNATPLYTSEPVDSLSDITLTPTGAKDNGNLLKFNASYNLNRDAMVYFTVSEGFRLGGSNGLRACTAEDFESPQQSVCASPGEEDYQPDTTTNYELGVKSTWFKNKVHFNAALFNVEWDDAQVQTTSALGAEIITSNAGNARSRGIELSTRAILGDNLTAYATYSYADAELTSYTEGLLLPRRGSRYSPEVLEEILPYYSGEPGDRLPGAPKQQFSMGISYEQEVFDDKLLIINYGLTAQGDVVTKVGQKADGEALPGYGLSNLSIKLDADEWSVTLYADNLFDKYAYSGTRRDMSWAGMGRYDDRSETRPRALPELQRVYGHFLIPPRTVGVKFDYKF